MMSSAAQPFDSSCARVSQRAESGSPCPVKFWGRQGPGVAQRRYGSPRCGCHARLTPSSAPLFRKRSLGGGRGDGGCWAASSQGSGSQESLAPAGFSPQPPAVEAAQGQHLSSRRTHGYPPRPIEHLAQLFNPFLSSVLLGGSGSVLREHGCPSWPTS